MVAKAVGYAVAAALGLTVGGCAHHVTYADPLADAGSSHQPYVGKPVYLASARPMANVGPTQEAQPCASRSAACDAKLRAALADLDLQTLALSTPPTDLQLQALTLAVHNVNPLLAAYPDVQAEGDEIGRLTADLPTHSVAEQAAVKQRLVELSDLIRIQIAAAR
jgi:hypothetical protein